MCVVIISLLSRFQRAAWLPYVENVNAIIFLAPISCFDERLAEVRFSFSRDSLAYSHAQDPSINRLEDSFILWKAICSSKLLANTTMIVFLNKCDLLKRKLKNGVHVRRYLTSFADRPNDVHTVVKCPLPSPLLLSLDGMRLTTDNAHRFA
jgi:guanine nucleotide-binding protein alpha-1 subunit